MFGGTSWKWQILYELSSLEVGVGCIRDVLILNLGVLNLVDLLSDQP